MLFRSFHPTFLYESLWLVGVALVVIWADRRFTMGHGRAFALYVLLYVLGRVWIELLRIDPANLVGGVRLNVWTSILVGIGAIAYLVASSRRLPGREPPDALLRVAAPTGEGASHVTAADPSESGTADNDPEDSGHRGAPR